MKARQRAWAGISVWGAVILRRERGATTLALPPGSDERQLGHGGQRKGLQGDGGSLGSGIVDMVFEPEAYAAELKDKRLACLEPLYSLYLPPAAAGRCGQGGASARESPLSVVSSLANAQAGEWLLSGFLTALSGSSRMFLEFMSGDAAFTPLDRMPLVAVWGNAGGLVQAAVERGHS